MKFQNANETCLHLISTGKLLLETPIFRYIKNGNLFFPCKKKSGFSNVYKVCTVLLYDEMVKKRFQKIIDIYHQTTSE